MDVQLTLTGRTIHRGDACLGMCPKRPPHSDARALALTAREGTTRTTVATPRPGPHPGLLGVGAARRQMRGHCPRPESPQPEPHNRGRVGPQPVSLARNRLELRHSEMAQRSCDVSQRKIDGLAPGLKFNTYAQTDRRTELVQTESTVHLINLQDRIRPKICAE